MLAKVASLGNAPTSVTTQGERIDSTRDSDKALLNNMDYWGILTLHSVTNMSMNPEEQVGF